MANKNDKTPGNVPGRFYVDNSCCDCDMCRNTAPTVFARKDDLAATIVTKQPVTPEEFILAESAVRDCPSDSIGMDSD
jgi:ferredoxin